MLKCACYTALDRAVHFWRAGAIQLMIAAGNVLISIVLVLVKIISNTVNEHIVEGML